MTLDKEGTVTAVVWDGPAWRAGIVAGAKVQLVNGTAYSAEVLKTAIVATSDGGKLDLQVARGAPTQESSVAWRGGPRYPHLERVPGSASLLDEPNRQNGQSRNSLRQAQTWHSSPSNCRAAQSFV